LGYIGIHQLIGGATHPFQKKQNKENSVIWYWELWVQPRVPGFLHLREWSKSLTRL